MIGYVMVGTNDMQKSAAFYDPLLAELGAKRFWEEDAFILYAASEDQPMFSITKPYDGNPATVGNGTMVALAAGSRANVDKLHAKALELGAANEGDPGVRVEEMKFYGAYFRDPDGNKLNFFHIGD